MKKIISMFLTLALFLCLCGCQNKVQKQIEFKHSEIYDKSIVFTIPDEWSYIEFLNTEEKILFNLLDSEYKVVASGLMSFQDVSQKQPLIELVTTNNGDKNIQINDDVFCCFPKNDNKNLEYNDDAIWVFQKDDNKPNLVYVRVEDELLIISFKRSVGKSTVKNIAKSITFKSIAETNSIKQPDTDNYSPPADLGTVDLSILESAEAIDKAHSIDTIKAIYNTLDRLNPIFEREWVGNITGFNTAYSYAYFGLNCDDGYFYRFVENYATGNFELWKSTSDEKDITEQSYDLIYRKPLPSDCNVVTTHRQSIICQAPYQIITMEQVEKIIATSNISALYKSDISLHFYELSESRNFFKTEYYVPEALAYFHITEDYTTNQAYYGFSAIGEHHEYIPSEYNKYNVSKELSPNAKIENHRKNGLHFDD